MICYFKNIITCVCGEWSSPLIILQETCSVLTYDNSRIDFAKLTCYFYLLTSLHYVVFELIYTSNKYFLIVGSIKH